MLLKWSRQYMYSERIFTATFIDCINVKHQNLVSHTILLNYVFFFCLAVPQFYSFLVFKTMFVIGQLNFVPKDTFWGIIIETLFEDHLSCKTTF